MPLIPATQEVETRDHKFKVSLGQVKEILSQKQNTKQRAGNVTQVLECVPTWYPWFNPQYQNETKQLKVNKQKTLKSTEFFKLKN
jgi:hypothetical protein